MTTGTLQLFDYLRSEKRAVRSLLVYALLGNVFLFAIPFLIQELIQQFSLLIFQQTTLFIILIAAAFLLGLAFLKALQLHLSERLQRRIFVKTMRRVQKIISENKKDSKAINLKKINPLFEAVTLQKSLIPLLLDGFTLVVQAMLVMLFISFYHPFFILYSIILILALYYILAQLGKKTERYSILESNKKYRVINVIQEALKDDSSKMDLDEHLLTYLETRELRYRYYFQQAIGILIAKVIASILLISLGGYLVVANQMTLGQLVASELIITNLLISLFKFTNLLDYWYDSVVGIDKVETYFPVRTRSENEVSGES